MLLTSLASACNSKVPESAVASFESRRAEALETVRTRQASLNDVAESLQVGLKAGIQQAATLGDSEAAFQAAATAITALKECIATTEKLVEQDDETKLVTSKAAVRRKQFHAMVEKHEVRLAVLREKVSACAQLAQAARSTLHSDQVRIAGLKAKIVNARNAPEDRY